MGACAAHVQHQSSAYVLEHTNQTKLCMPCRAYVCTAHVLCVLGDCLFALANSYRRDQNVKNIKSPIVMMEDVYGNAPTEEIREE